MKHIIFSLTTLFISTSVLATTVDQFEGLSPSTNDSTLKLPEDFNYQTLIGALQPMMSNPSGDSKYAKAGIRNDMAVFAPLGGSSSTEGVLSINHESKIATGSYNKTAGLSLLDIKFNESSRLWDIEDSSRLRSHNEDLYTVGNCSGTLTPWNTVVSCEEYYSEDNATDPNSGFANFGFCFEFDPFTKSVDTYTSSSIINADPTPKKMWTLGAMFHENVEFNPQDPRVILYGDDGKTDTDCLYAAATPTAGNFDQAYVYYLKNSGSASNPSASGEWQYTGFFDINNMTPDDYAKLNNMKDICHGETIANVDWDQGLSLNTPEDVRFHPTNGKAYVAANTAKTIFEVSSPTYDQLSAAQNFTYNDFRIFAKGNIKTNGTGATIELGNVDNLQFDLKGNLWVLEDNDDENTNKIIVFPNQYNNDDPHTDTARIFAYVPEGFEPTGLSFTPDNTYAFLSFMTPDLPAGTNTDSVGLNAPVGEMSFTVVIGHKYKLGETEPIAADRFKLKVAIEGVTDNPSGGTLAELILAGTTNTKIFPSNQPFTNSAPYFYAGSDFFPVSNWEQITSDIPVRWALLSAIPTPNGTLNGEEVPCNLNDVPQHQIAALILKNGDVVDTLGSDQLHFPGLDTTQGYRLRIQTINNLGVLTSSNIPFGGSIDLTTSQDSVVGIEQLKHLNDGTYGLRAGDYAAPYGNINNFDYNAWETNNSAVSQYLPHDGDANGIINNLDYNLWDKNKSKVGHCRDD